MSTSASAIVEEIDAAILAMLAGGGAQTLSFGDRSITYTSLTELREARSQYAALADGTGARGMRISPIHNGGTVTTGGQS
jgi:hypothetical protein